MKPNQCKNSLAVEQANIVFHEQHEGQQSVLRLYAPKIAQKAIPGQFVHVRCSQHLEMRRPLSIMLTDKNKGTIDLLYKITGKGTTLLSRHQVNESLSLMGPIGQPFKVTKKYPLFIGGGVGMPPMIFLSQTLSLNTDITPFVILGSEVPFPFPIVTSKIAIPHIDKNVTANLSMLEGWQIGGRLTSLQPQKNYFQGYVTELATQWLEGLNKNQQNQVEICACGPHPMLKAVADLAQKYSLPCQLSLEEYMACGIGGCAGCTVPIHTEQGMQMKRVCVDGPIFPAHQVFGSNTPC